jgi:energy-coupling factor transporter transmembrane protein EcfT
MRFRNPENGYIEEKTVPWLWTLLFGGLYFIASGLIAQLIIWLIGAIALFALMGPPATVFLIVIDVVCAALASKWVSDAYLRKGWIEIPDDETATASSPVTKETAFRQCPFCAEEVRIEAIKCKHCSSDIHATSTAIDDNLSKVEITKTELNQRSIRSVDGAYWVGINKFNTAEAAVAYSKSLGIAASKTQMQPKESTGYDLFLTGFICIAIVCLILYSTIHKKSASDEKRETLKIALSNCQSQRKNAIADNWSSDAIAMMSATCTQFQNELDSQ